MAKEMEANEPQDEFTADLHPDPEAGQNTGQRLPEDVQTAYDIPLIHNALDGFNDDELKRIPIVPEGTRLKQGAIYVDLLAPDREEIKARGDMEAGPVNAYVPKNEVDFQLFNRLIGITTPERLGEADEG